MFRMGTDMDDRLDFDCRAYIAGALVLALLSLGRFLLAQPVPIIVDLVAAAAVILAYQALAARMERVSCEVADERSYQMRYLDAKRDALGGAMVVGVAGVVLPTLIGMALRLI